MQVTETLNDGLKRSYTITVPAADLEAKVHEKLVEAQPEIEMKGFRKGKVPMPILRKQFPEIVDFYLPPEGCSYRLAVVTMRKAYPGHAKRVMLGIWSYLRQFMYTKFIIVTDDDVDARNWSDVVWALTTRVDPTRCRVPSGACCSSCSDYRE